jgi:hypothetical protein
MIMWGTTSNGDELTGTFGGALEDTSIGDIGGKKPGGRRRGYGYGYNSILDRWGGHATARRRG